MSVYWALGTEQGKLYETKVNPESPVVRPCIFNSPSDVEAYARAKTSRFPEPIYIVPVMVIASPDGLLAAMAKGPILMGEAAEGEPSESV